MFALDRPLGRGAFVGRAAALVAAKGAIDLALAAAFGRSFSLWFYVTPTSSPLWSPPTAAAGWFGGSGAGGAYWLLVVACAIPFAAIGLALTIRRLRDAGLSPWLAAFFFAPFLKLVFFVALAVAPTRARTRVVEVRAGPFRSTTIDMGPEPTTTPKRRAIALAAGTLAGDALALASMGISVGLLRDYGWPLMIATPAIAGFVATWVYARMWKPTAGGAVLVTFTTFVIGMVMLGVAAIEGFGCITMLAPLFFGEALLGALLAQQLARVAEGPPYATLGSSLVMLPVAFAAHGASPPSPEESLPIESSVVVHAPADVVWKRVVAFPPLPAPTEALFRAGIAAPLAATIDGEGVGAVRRCEFTTGTFVEPIDVWRPGRELGFSVASQPDPMRELTLYRGPRPPHLDGYLQSTRGQFLLEPLPDGSTRLTGRTWYRVHTEPVAYWRVWGDSIIHAIHMRVLEHVKGLAEADAAAGR